MQIPWKQILFSRPVIALNIATLCGAWSFYTVLTCIPTYMKDILKLDMTQVSFGLLYIKDSFVKMILSQTYLIIFRIVNKKWLHLLSRYKNTPNFCLTVLIFVYVLW